MTWAPQTSLQVEDLAFSYPGAKHPSLAGISFSATPGEFLACIGPSGSGKSTLLKLISGLLSPLTGRVRFGEHEMARIAAADRRIGYVPQELAIYPHLTAFHNVYLPLRARGMAPGEANRLAHSTLGRLKLAAFARRRASSLSGGERQRLALSRVLAWRPAILCLDEPLSNVDAVARPEILGLIREAHQDLGAITIYITHAATEALSISSRVLMLDRGHQVQLGLPQDLYLEPNHISTARLLSDGPLLEATVDRLSSPASDQLALVVGGVEIVGTPLRHLQDNVSDHRTLTVALRPEHFRISPSDPNSTGIAIRVLLADFYGSRFLITFGSWLPGLSAWSNERLAPGTEVVIQPTPLPLSVFCKHTGTLVASLRMTRLAPRERD